MATITIRIDDAARDLLAQQAAAHGRTVSETVRDAVDQLIGRAGPAEGDSESRYPRSMGLAVRRLLSLEHQALAMLERQVGHDGDAEASERLAQALERGFTAEYGDVFAGIDDEMSYSECHLLCDLLEMFSVLDASTARLPQDALSEQEQRWLTFQGFDANDRRENKMRSYARFLLDDDRYDNMARYFDDAHDQGNSHMPRLALYLRLLDRFTPIRHQRLRGQRGSAELLSSDELRDIASAAPLRRDA